MDFKCLDKMDWDLLHQQKQMLVSVMKQFPANGPVNTSLNGILHLIDAIQDEAVDVHDVWAFPQPCNECGRDDLPLYTDGLCPECSPRSRENEHSEHGREVPDHSA